MSPLSQSLTLHAAIMLLFAAAVWILPGRQMARSIQVQVLEVEKPQLAPSAPVVRTRAQDAPPAKSARPVFGINKNSLKTAAPGAVEVKAGNTLAKAIDQEVLKPEDEGALPVPAEEYLVTSMPRLKNERRVPYPPEAKAKNIEGVVVMDVLIDESGRVRGAVLVQGPGFGLDQAAMQAIYQFEFQPAMIDRKPVAVRIRYAYRFLLN